MLLLRFLIFLFVSNSFACECGELLFTSKYIQADFVADITILKIYPNVENVSGYKADIQINKIYKGDSIKSIQVYGNIGTNIRTSCDLYLPVGERIIAYAKVNSEGNFGVGFCSNSYFFNKVHSSLQANELELLELFQKKNVLYTNKFEVCSGGPNLIYSLWEMDGFTKINTFGIYEITYSSELEVTNVKVIYSFDNIMDAKIIDLLKSQDWISCNRKKDAIAPENGKRLIGFFYIGESTRPRRFKNFVNIF